MDILLFIALTSVVVVLIALAIDIPTTKWEGFHARRPRKRTLLSILEAITDTDTQEAHVETKPPATTYTEATKRMQEREKARLLREASESDSS